MKPNLILRRFISFGGVLSFLFLAVSHGLGQAVATAVYNFAGTANPTGAYPAPAPFVLGSDGNYYGTAELGGVAGIGTIFKFTPEGALTTIVSFDGVYNAPTQGAKPESGLVLASDGNFYGTTYGGGLSGGGSDRYFCI